jgi:uncharacterized protein (DUF983 family)
MHTDDLAGKEVRRPIPRSMWRGFRKRCPSCGAGRIFRRYLKPVDACDHCGAVLGEIRTDDFAPWLTILLLGHILVPVLGTVDYLYAPALWIILLFATALSAILVLLLLLLPHAKGLCLGLMWTLGLRGDEQH